MKYWQLIILLTGLILISACSEDSKCPTGPTNPGDLPYEVDIDPADFITEGFTGNEFMPLVPGTTFVYEGENEDGEVVRVEEYITHETVEIMGVTCIVVEAKEWEAGEMVEDTDDWYAQELNGNIWYFGEYSEEIEDGEVVGTEGSWEAGVDGALPGIIMLADPYVGMWYRQEYYEGEAEDVALILSINATVTIGLGTYEHCLQTAEWALLEPGIIEHKFYAPDVGLIRAVAVEGETGYEDLIEIINE